MPRKDGRRPVMRAAALVVFPSSDGIRHPSTPKQRGWQACCNIATPVLKPPFRRRPR
jgi:hypothetical protein